VRQKTGLPSYQIASLVDDTHFGITHIVRGRDLHPSTLVQRRIASILAPNHPFLSVVVYHHPLITDDRGTKLSKSQGAMGVREMIAAGQPPEALIAIATTMANHFGEV
jgi:glutamyl-tRNA synthetase